jgi:hypothetical protein
MTRIILCALIIVSFCGSAEAKSKKNAPDSRCNIDWPCDFSYGPEVFKESRRVARGEAVAKAVGFGAVRIRAQDRQSVAVPAAVQRVAAAIVAHPSGCPSRAFCGCGAAVRVFGSPIRSLWLAANWFKFPRAAPAPGTVAVRRHHVFVLEADLGGGVWSVYDANSGGHATRIHARSIAGYTIVNPHGGAA